MNKCGKNLAGLHNRFKSSSVEAAQERATFERGQLFSEIHRTKVKFQLAIRVKIK